jgi:photosynthetic reaction center cytochrome c subunit
MANLAGGGNVRAWRAAAGALVCALAWTLAAGQAAGAAAGKTAAERFKNIQVLKTIPAEDLLPTMRYIAASLGVQCGFCHVMGPDRPFDKDDKKEKRTAREMMQMVMGINQGHFQGRQEVSCNSCHNGHSRPQIAPQVATEASLKERMAERPANEERGEGPPPQREALPSAAALFEKYEQAIGGGAAVARITTLYTKGTVSLPMGTAEFEQYNKAPDKVWVSTTTPRGGRVQAWDGSRGWVQMGRVEPMRDTAEMKLNSDFYRSLKLAGQYAEARVVRKEKIGDRDAWLVMGRIPDSEFTDLLDFDVASGLLLRRTTLRRTALGPLPTQLDFDDYRDTGGVKMPYKLTVATPESVQHIQVDELKTNLPVEDSRFAMPKQETPGGR